MSTTHVSQKVRLHVGYPLPHVVYNDGEEAHHPCIAMPCFFPAQVVHNSMGIAVGQRDTVGRGVPAVQPWEPPSDLPWKSRTAQPAISQNQKSRDRIGCRVLPKSTLAWIWKSWRAQTDTCPAEMSSVQRSSRRKEQVTCLSTARTSGRSPALPCTRKRMHKQQTSTLLVNGHWQCFPNSCNRNLGSTLQPD